MRYYRVLMFVMMMTTMLMVIDFQFGIELCVVRCALDVRAKLGILFQYFKLIFEVP